MLALIKIYFSSNTKSFQILANAIVNVQCSSHMTLQRRDYRYQRGNQNPYIEKQTPQCPKEICTKEKQRSTKHTYEAKVRVTRIPLKPGVNSGVPEGPADPAPLVAPVVLI